MSRLEEYPMGSSSVHFSPTSTASHGRGANGGGGGGSGDDDNDNSTNARLRTQTPTLISQHPYLGEHFRRMCGYFNILDRVFHPKRSYTSVQGDTTGATNSIDIDTQLESGITNENEHINNDDGSNNNNNNISSSSRNSQTPQPLGYGIDGVFSNLAAKPESNSVKQERLRRLEEMASLDGGYQEYLVKYFNNNDNVDISGGVEEGDADMDMNDSRRNSRNNAHSSNNRSGEMYEGEYERQDKPPTYEEASHDAVPAYWDLSPESALYYDEICVDGLPAGNLINFFWNCLISGSFKFFGFLITYVLHTSHAAKEGSRCGLGITFILFAYSLFPNNVSHKVGKGKDILRVQLSNPDQHTGEFLTTTIDNNLYLDKDILTSTGVTTTLSPTATGNPHSDKNNNIETKPDSSNLDTFHSTLSHGYEETNSDKNKYLDVLSIIIFVVGSIMIVNSFYNYYMIKKQEKSIMRQQNSIQEIQELQQQQQQQQSSMTSTELPSFSMEQEDNDNDNDQGDGFESNDLPITLSTTSLTASLAAMGNESNSHTQTSIRRSSTVSSLVLNQSTSRFDDLSMLDHNEVQSDFSDNDFSDNENP